MNKVGQRWNWASKEKSGLLKNRLEFWRKLLLKQVVPDLVNMATR
jgi:hypothetical protein